MKKRRAGGDTACILAQAGDFKVWARGGRGKGGGDEHRDKATPFFKGRLPRRRCSTCMLHIDWTRRTTHRCIDTDEVPLNPFPVRETVIPLGRRRRNILHSNGKAFGN